MSHTPNLSVGTHRFKTRNSSGSTLEYIVKGNQSGPIITILPPAWGPGSRYLQESFQQLYKDFAVVFLEFRANGASDRPQSEDDMNTRSCAEDVEELRVHLGLDSFPMLVGHSNGGEIALWYSVRFPTRVKVLTLLCHRFSDYPDRAAGMEEVLAIKQQKYPKESDRIQSFKANMFKKVDWTDQEFTEFFRKHIPLYFADPQMGEATYVFPDTMPVWNYKNIYNPSKLRLFGDDVSEVRAKAYIFVGAHDPVCTYGQAEATKIGLKNTDCEIYQFEDSGHFPWVEAPERFWEQFFQVIAREGLQGVSSNRT